MAACFHCGELYDAKLLVCPHCGTDREFPYAETPPETVVEDSSQLDDTASRDFLEKEGLAPRRHRVSRKPLWWGLLILAAISGLFLLLL